MYRMCLRTVFPALLVSIISLLGVNQPSICFGSARSVYWCPHDVQVPDSNINFTSVWGSSAQDVFATTNTGAIYHFNGTSWSPMTSGTTANLQDIWGTSGSDVFTVGYGGTILHYNGTNWSAMTSGTTNDLTGVWGSAGDDVFAVGHDDTILRYNGTNWSPMDSGVDLTKYMGFWGADVWGTSSSDVYTIGSVTDLNNFLYVDNIILHYDGSDWSESYSFDNYGYDLWAIWGTSGSDVYVVKRGGQSGHVFSSVLHYDGNTWSGLPRFPSSDLYMNSIWGASSNNLFVVGSYSYDQAWQGGAINHYDGSTWSTVPTGLTGDTVLRDVWGSGTDIFAVGDNGTVLHITGECKLRNFPWELLINNFN